jgi:hypothetical protein
MRSTLPILALLMALVGSCVSTDEEWACRLAVKRLVAAPERLVEAETRRVVAYGTYALPDIEQELHVAPAKGRLRLLEALRRIGSPESLPLLEFLGRRDTDDAVRERAAQIAAMLRRSTSNK